VQLDSYKFGAYVDLLGIGPSCLVHSVIFSVVFEVSHPGGPISRLNAAGCGPGAGLVIYAMPLECPQLLESGLSDGPIQKSHAYESIVPVNADTSHMLHPLPGQILYFRRVIRIPGEDIEPQGVHKQRHIAGTFDIGCSPVIFGLKIFINRRVWFSTHPFIP